MKLKLRLDPFDQTKAGELKVFYRLADDERGVAEREWRAPLKPSAAQEPADIGLFGDEPKQCDLFDPLDKLVDVYRE